MKMFQPNLVVACSCCCPLFDSNEGCSAETHFINRGIALFNQIAKVAVNSFHVNCHRLGRLVGIIEKQELLYSW